MSTDATVPTKRPKHVDAPRRATGDFTELELSVVSLHEASETPSYAWRFDVRVAEGECSWLGSSGELRSRSSAQQQDQLDELAHDVLALESGSSGAPASSAGHMLTIVTTLGWTREPPRPTPLCVRWSIVDCEGSGRETGPAQLRLLIEHIAALFGAALPALERTRLDETLGLFQVPAPMPAYDWGDAVPAPAPEVPIPFEAGVSVRLGQQPGPEGLYRIRRDADEALLRVIRATDQAVLAEVSCGQTVEIVDAFALQWSGANSLQLAPRSTERLYIQRLDPRRAAR